MNYPIEAKRNERGELKIITLLPIEGVEASEAKKGRPGETKLEIRTYKGFNRGELRSFASVNFYGENFVTHAFGMGSGRGDYDRTLIRTPGRATEKNLRAVHAEALKLVPAVIEEAKAFYAAQAGKEGS